MRKLQSLIFYAEKIDMKLSNKLILNDKIHIDLNLLKAVHNQS